jgi:hypothetical protein
VRNRPTGGSGIEAVLASPRQVRRVMPWLARTPDGAAVMQVDLDGRGGGRSGSDGPDSAAVLGLLP